MSMVGGRVIEVLPMCLENGRAVIRLWCVEGSDECAVYSEPYESGAGPKVGDNISWQSGLHAPYFNLGSNDNPTLRTVRLPPSNMIHASVVVRPAAVEWPRRLPGLG